VEFQGIDISSQVIPLNVETISGILIAAHVQIMYRKHDQGPNQARIRPAEGCSALPETYTATQNCSGPFTKFIVQNGSPSGSKTKMVFMRLTCHIEYIGIPNGWYGGMVITSIAWAVRL
jgi:hypothetical protein